MVSVPDCPSQGIFDLWIGQTEVTWDLLECWALGLDTSFQEGVDAVSYPSKPYSAIFANFGHHGHPAICVSFAAATEFCHWLAKVTGRPYRLPAANEWVYCCSHDPATDIDSIAWHWGNSDDTTHRVAQKAANNFGLFDTFGNVAEWCADRCARGGSWMTKPELLCAEFSEPEDSKWNEADPQSPKSLWWLANGQHIGLRLAATGLCKIE